MKYKILIEPVICEQEIKKSKFITYLSHTESIEQGRQFWQEIKKKHPTARHHCWAMLAGAPNNSMLYGFSDDGEPSGTAGKPMLSCLSGSEIGEISAVVVRYFGGILLGTGGLVKAYASSVQQALSLTKTIDKIELIEAELDCNYHEIDLICNILLQNQAEILHKDFTDKVHILFKLPPELFDITKKIIIERTSNQVIIYKRAT